MWFSPLRYGDVTCMQTKHTHLSIYLHPTAQRRAVRSIAENAVSRGTTAPASCPSPPQRALPRRRPPIEALPQPGADLPGAMGWAEARSLGGD